jgi:hypothetical protein
MGALRTPRQWPSNGAKPLNLKGLLVASGIAKKALSGYNISYFIESVPDAADEYRKASNLR